MLGSRERKLYDLYLALNSPIALEGIDRIGELYRVAGVSVELDPQLVGRFHSAVALVLAAPLWNFGVPYKLKHLIDVVSQKDPLFSLRRTGVRGDGRENGIRTRSRRRGQSSREGVRCRSRTQAR